MNLAAVSLFFCLVSGDSPPIMYISVIGAVNLSFPPLKLAWSVTFPLCVFAFPFSVHFFFQIESIRSRLSEFICPFFTVDVLFKWGWSFSLV